MHKKMNCVPRSMVSIRFLQDGPILNKAQEPFASPLEGKQQYSYIVSLAAPCGTQNLSSLTRD